MKHLQIEPLEDIVYIDIPSAKAGILNTDSRSSAVEFAEVITVGPNVKNLKKGDKVFVKSWACDIITHEEKRYYFVNIKTNGILAKVL